METIGEFFQLIIQFFQIPITVYGFTFSFYSRGIEYTGTASVSGVNATYQDPSADYSLVFEINGSQISVADQGDFPGANVSWEGVYRLE